VREGGEGEGDDDVGGRTGRAGWEFQVRVRGVSGPLKVARCHAVPQPPHRSFRDKKIGSLTEEVHGGLLLLRLGLRGRGRGRGGVTAPAAPTPAAPAPAPAARRLELLDALGEDLGDVLALEGRQETGDGVALGLDPDGGEDLLDGRGIGAGVATELGLWGVERGGEGR